MSGPIFRRRYRPIYGSFSGSSSLRRSSRATSGLERRQAMGNPFCSTTSSPRVQRLTFVLQRRLFMAQRKALGRGLSALLGTAVIQAPPETASVEVEGEQLREIDIDRILPNTQQPRKIFDESALNELAESIRAHGVIQPVVVQPLPDNFYELIAGERRWRAAQKAGLHKLPALVRETGPNASLEIALIENLQREDLNPIEEAQAYQRLISEFGLTQEEVAKRVGKSRVTVANMVRLLRLPPEVQQWMSEQKLTTGHAKALLSLLSPDAILLAARKMIQGNYSVRQAELFVARFGKK